MGLRMASGRKIFEEIIGRKKMSVGEEMEKEYRSEAITKFKKMEINPAIIFSVNRRIRKMLESPA